MKRSVSIVLLALFGILILEGNFGCHGGCCGKTELGVSVSSPKKMACSSQGCLLVQNQDEENAVTALSFGLKTPSFSEELMGVEQRIEFLRKEETSFPTQKVFLSLNHDIPSHLKYCQFLI